MQKSRLHGCEAIQFFYKLETTRKIVVCWNSGKSGDLAGDVRKGCQEGEFLLTVGTKSEQTKKMDIVLAISPRCL